MIQAVLFDCFGVLVDRQGLNVELKQIILRRLKGRVKLGVFSNMGHNNVPGLLGEELTSCFDAILISGELGVGKPDQRAYLLATGKMREFAENCVLIDDSERNIAGAQAVGMAAIHYTNNQRFRQLIRHNRSC